MSRDQVKCSVLHLLQFVSKHLFIYVDLVVKCIKIDLLKNSWNNPFIVKSAATITFLESHWCPWQNLFAKRCLKLYALYHCTSPWLIKIQNTETNSYTLLTIRKNKFSDFVAWPKLRINYFNFPNFGNLNASAKGSRWNNRAKSSIMLEIASVALKCSVT